MPCFPEANLVSAELEMTVNMLIQIDKLVQLLESPVFTCRPFFIPSRQRISTKLHRPPPPASRTGALSTPLQMSVRRAYASTTVLRLRRS
jgi:hypothetical protein